MYRWNVRRVWRQRVQHLRRWKVFVRPRSKLLKLRRRQILQWSGKQFVLDVREHSLHGRGWHDHTYDMQHVYRRIQVRRNIHKNGMYRWNVRRVWRQRVQHLRRWKVFVRRRSKLLKLRKRPEIQRLEGDHVLDVRGW